VKLSSVLAEHFRKGKLPEKEIVYRLIAAKEASSVGAWKTAIYHLNLLEERLDDKLIAIRDQSEIAMQMYMLRGNLYALIPNPDKALDNYKQLQTIATAHQSKCYLAYAFLGYGILERALGNFTKAIEFAEYVREIVDEATCLNALADCYLLVAKSHKDLAQYAEVLEWAKKAEGAYEKIGDLIGILDSRSQIAYAHYARGNYVVAKSMWEANLYEAPEYASLPPDPDDDVYFCLGFLNWRLGEYKKAHDYLSTALESAKKVNYKRKEAYCLNNLGFVETSFGNFDQAEKILAEALTIFQELGDKKGESWAYGNLGNVMFHSGKYKEAIRFLQKNLVLAEEIGLKSDLAEANRRLSEAYFHDGKLLEAYHHALQGLQEAEKLGRRAFIGMIYRIMGNIAVKAASDQQDGLAEMGKPEEYFGMSVKIARETQSQSEENLSLEAWGKYLISLNDGESKLKGEEFLKQAEKLKS
jgi:tetratricopeptide (TPR) repeat protein